jgi:hypothetical protein
VSIETRLKLLEKQRPQPCKIVLLRSIITDTGSYVQKRSEIYFGAGEHPPGGSWLFDEEHLYREEDFHD